MQPNKKIHFPVIQAQPIKKKKGFKEILSFLSFRRSWKIKETYYVWSDLLHVFIVIPVHFIFDGASMPKALYSIYSSNGVLLYGACPHDFGYKYEGLILCNEKGDRLRFKFFTRKELDNIFHGLNVQESGMKKASRTATMMLRLFGRFAWNKHRKNECKVFRDFPLFIENESVVD